jgi:hypothetical protein
LRTYSIHERAFASLLMQTHDEIRRLTGLFEWLADDPVGVASGAGLDADSKRLYVCDVRGFRIFYALSPDGRSVSIEDIVPRAERSC